jgi:GR25 family glycosyltransferase involved in LPS biosynthesis
VAAVYVINLKGRGDRYKKFIEHANTIEWRNDTKIVRVLATEPSHSLLKKGAVFGASAKQSVAESTIKRDKCRACVLSHIQALIELEKRDLTPALICEDDLVLTRDNAKLCAPLPAIAVVISVGHDAAMTSDSPIVNRTIDGRGEPLVAVKHGGYKSSSAGYLIPTRAKSQELRMKLEKELRQGLSSQMDVLLFHPRLFADQHKGVFLTKRPLFVQDPSSWSSIESSHVGNHDTQRSPMVVGTLVIQIMRRMIPKH